MPNLQDNSGKHDKGKRFFFDGETVKIIDGIFAFFRHTDILYPMAERKFRKSQVAVFFQKLRGNIAEGVLILRNSSIKLNNVADNAILRHHAVSSENISERIKIKTEN